MCTFSCLNYKNQWLVLQGWFVHRHRDPCNTHAITVGLTVRRRREADARHPECSAGSAGSTPGPDQSRQKMCLCGVTSRLRIMLLWSNDDAHQEEAEARVCYYFQGLRPRAFAEGKALWQHFWYGPLRKPNRCPLCCRTCWHTSQISFFFSCLFPPHPWSQRTRTHSISKIN